MAKNGRGMPAGCWDTSEGSQRSGGMPLSIYLDSIETSVDFLKIWE